MKRLLSLMLVLGLMVAVSCTSTTDPMATTDSTQAAQAEDDAPDWFYSPPSEPGIAFFGVGVVEHVNNVGLAKSAAEKRAIAELAGVLNTQIKEAVKDYMRSIVANSGDSEEEQLIQRVSIATVNQSISGAVVKNRARGAKNDKGIRPFYAIARIGFDSVAANLHKAVKENIQQVKANADDAFAELDGLLKKQQETSTLKGQGGDIPKGLEAK